MRNVLSISLPDEILKTLRNESKNESASVSEVVRKALKDYFFRSEFDRVRKKAQLDMAKRGIKPTEEDILDNRL